MKEYRPTKLALENKINEKLENSTADVKEFTPENF